MDELEIRKIAEDVFKQMSQQSQYDVPDTPYHEHNATDASQLNSGNIKYFFPLNADAGGILNPNVSTGRPLFFNQSPRDVSRKIASIPVYPLPVISGDLGSETLSFQGGKAPDGTLVLFLDVGGFLQLWASFNDVWYGVNMQEFTLVTLALTGSLLAGATSATLLEPWGYVTGFYSIEFSNGNTRTGHMINGTAAFTWTGGGLSSGAAATIQIANV